MKYSELKKKAIRIDKFIDMNRKSFKLPMKEIVAIIKYLFPSCYTESKGYWKSAFTICPQRGSKGEMLILKIGKKESIKDDLKVYKMLPKNIRTKIFAKIHWHTKYCLLQEYGEKVKLTHKDIKELELIGLKYGLNDITGANIRKVNGNLKIIDANVLIKGKKRRYKLLKHYIGIRLS